MGKTDGMRDPYEDQLAAARYRAERDQARQELERERHLRKLAESAAAERYTVRAEDHEAAAWVRDNGGLAKVQARLMPEGMEWPRYDTGEPVQIGGEFMGKDGKTYTAKQIQFIGKCFSLYDFCDRKPQFNGFYGEPVKRPAVLAADGEPLEVGQTVRGIGRSQHEFEVLALNDVNPEVGDRFNVKCFDKDENEECWCDPNMLTHKRPVLDACGVPIRKGDTVWCVATDEELTDMSIIRDCWSKMREKLTVESFITDAHGDKWAGFEETSIYAKTCYLTHAKPEQDSWERIEEDAGCTATKYNERRGTIFTTKQQVARELVRRCRALAERERGE